MRRSALLMLPALLTFTFICGQRISGIVTDDKGNILPFASVLIKGTTKGTTANNEGKYFLNAGSGKQTLICQYVGYERQERTIAVETGNTTVNFC